MEQLNVKETQTNLQQIIEKSWEDETFKKQLIADPVKTIESFFGEKLQKGQELRYVVTDQSDANTVYINIPMNPNISDMELSDAELEAVAGGWYMHIFNTGLCFGDGPPPCAEE